MAYSISGGDYKGNPINPQGMFYKRALRFGDFDKHLVSIPREYELASFSLYTTSVPWCKTYVTNCDDFLSYLPAGDARR
jgi:hypothetical protein